ncbi:hypothetical protein BJV82DRAFT_671503 [Fennellomyces sp. T-0311]|nr:hypothetical protein BJV82DRAFT_671503 [Fennellomyces sp. T-0311]
MDTVWDTLEVQAFLGGNIATTIVSFGALIGSVTSSLKTGRQQRMVHALSIASVLSLLICEILIFVTSYATGGFSFEILIAATFFNNIFPPLVWYLLFRILHLSGEARLRYQDPAKYKKAARAESYVKIWTVILIIINIVLAILDGIGITDNYGYTVLYLFQYMANGLFVVQFMVQLIAMSYHRDVRPFAGSFYVVGFLLICVSAGSVTVAVLTVTKDLLNVRGLLMLFMVRLAGSLALLMMVGLFQTTWMRRIRENQIKNDYISGEPLNNEDSWNPNAPYDTNRQEFIRASEEQKYFAQQ